MTTIKKIAVFGKALRSYREDYGLADIRATKLVGAMQALCLRFGDAHFDMPASVKNTLIAVDRTAEIAHLPHGRFAHEWAIRAAAQEIADWADPPRKEEHDADVSALITDHGRAAE